MSDEWGSLQAKDVEKRGLYSSIPTASYYLQHSMTRLLLQILEVFSASLTLRFDLFRPLVA